MESTVNAIAEAARAEASKMRAVISNSDPLAKVSMSVSQFDTLAQLIEAMSELLVRPDSGSFGDARYWVPLDRFVKLRESAASLERQCQALQQSCVTGSFGNLN